MAAVVNRVADVLSVAPPPLGGLEPCNVNRRDKGDYSKLSSNRRSLVVEVESSSMRARREVEDTRYDRCVEELEWGGVRPSTGFLMRWYIQGSSQRAPLSEAKYF